MSGADDVTPKKPPPAGWPRIASTVFYDDANAAIDWLCRAFGFALRLVVRSEHGHVEYSELTFGDGLVMVGQSGGKSTRPEPMPWVSPRALGGVVTQVMCVCVDDVDAHCARARAAGARVVDEPATRDHGEGYWCDRSYRAIDLEGHHWYFMQRLREQAR